MRVPGLRKDDEKHVRESADGYKLLGLNSASVTKLTHAGGMGAKLSLCSIFICHEEKRCLKACRVVLLAAARENVLAAVHSAPMLTLGLLTRRKTVAHIAAMIALAGVMGALPSLLTMLKVA